MKITRIREVFGFGFTIYRPIRAVVVTFFSYAWLIRLPVVAACTTPLCGHGPEMHFASREYGTILWTCYGSSNTCECEHYSPQIAARRFSFK